MRGSTNIIPAVIASIILATLVITVGGFTASVADELFNWRTYSYPEFGFTVMFPDEAPTVTKTEKSGTLQHTWIVHPPGIVFQVNVAEVMPANFDLASVRAICDALRNQMMSVDGAVRVYRVSQTLTPACEVVYDTDYDETLSVRLYIAGSRFYQTFVRGPRGYDSSDDSAKFLESFHVLSR